MKYLSKNLGGNWITQVQLRAVYVHDFICLTILLFEFLHASFESVGK